ncbi:uncharacterized protein LOC8060196 [Sorghum bicolor]|uniref:DUF642 domain-containing protein n=1 Tax=Sorghum bicolor TaxID=4558 RepID=A0A1B6PLT9_SORBI|nr:uncharacterized protein LOC8060196 [Sorghum bicolor]KXG26629.1 hypothetical protein SORBI_3006G132800 [Sorghum bicolor]|eukprot:XP_002446723.2 uncharacterized protein LOC8060196 [Sorghum bicolor]
MLYVRGYEGRGYPEMAIGKRSVHGAALVLLLVVCVAARAVSAVGDGPLLNGNFEDSPNPSQMSGSVVTGEHAISYWRTSGHIEFICSGQTQGDMVLTVPDGAHALRLGNGASIEQRISLTPGSYYSLTFSASRTCAQDEVLNVTAAPVSGSGAAAQTGELPIQTVYTSSGWDSYSWAFKAEAGLVSIIITHICGEQEDPACGPVVDAFAIKTLSQPEATGDNLLRNGDFEEGPYIPPESPCGVMLPPMDQDCVSPLPGWKIMSYKKSVKYVDSAHFAVPRGARAVELVSGVETALMQEVYTTVEGSWYRLEFSVGDAANGCASPSYDDGSSSGGMKVKAYAGSSETTVDIDFHGAGGSKRGKIEFRATANPTRVVFVSLGYHTKCDNSGTLCGPVVDDVSLVPIPQPYARRLLL